MKIVIIGGTGLIGSKLVSKLQENGHEAIPAAPDTGVNTLTGEGLAEVLAGADAVVVGNTGAAHLAAAVGTPVVSLFSPVVDERCWRPFGVPTIVLGRTDVACAGTRARICPVPGHPCLSDIRPEQVVDAVMALRRHPAPILDGAAAPTGPDPTRTAVPA